MPTGVPNPKPAPSDEPVVLSPAVEPVPQTNPEVARMSVLDKMRDYFKTQERVRIKIRNEGDVPVQINGYTFVVQSNVAVDVPKDVAQLLEEAGYI